MSKITWKIAFPDFETFKSRMGNTLISPLLVNDELTNEILFDFASRRYRDRFFSMQVNNEIGYDKIVSLVEESWNNAYLKFIKLESLSKDIVANWKALKKEDRLYITNNTEEKNIEEIIESFLTGRSTTSREKINNDELYLKLITLPSYSSQFIKDLASIFLPFAGGRATIEDQPFIFLSGENLTSVGLIDENGNFTGSVDRVYSKEGVNALILVNSLEIENNTSEILRNKGDILDNQNNIVQDKILIDKNTDDIEKNVNDIVIINGEQITQNTNIVSNSARIDSLDQRTSTISEEYSPPISPNEVLPTVEMNYDLSNTIYNNGWIPSKNYEFVIWNHITAPSEKIVVVIKINDVPLNITFPSGNFGTVTLDSITNTLTIKDTVGTFGTLAYITQISQLAEVGAGTPLYDNHIERQTILSGKIWAQLLESSPEENLDYVNKLYVDTINSLQDLRIIDVENKTEHISNNGLVFEPNPSGSFKHKFDGSDSQGLKIETTNNNGFQTFIINGRTILKIWASGNIDVNNNNIDRVADGTLNAHAINLKQLNEKIVVVAFGDTPADEPNVLYILEDEND